MNNDEVIELTALCGALFDGTLSPEQRERLNAMLKASTDAREFYVRHAAMSSSLYSYAAEMQTDAPRVVPAKPRILRWAGALAAAAVVVFALYVWMRPAEVGTVSTETRLVALMTGTKDCEWSGAAMSPGASLQAGQRLDLAKGYAEITFDSGAQLTMEGPASLVVSSAWDASLVKGSVKASVPEEAIGFRVSHSSVDVVDLGTEFSMIADDDGGAEVLVLKGTVEAAAHGESKAVVLREKESRRFARDGVSDVHDRDRKFARFAKVYKLDRAAITGDYAHWTFDESEGSVLLADARNKKKGGIHAKLDANVNATLTEGRWSKALSFNGRLVAKAAVPGISASGTARTVGFWVRVQEHAAANGNGSILGWGQKYTRKHAVQSARIAWNKSPAQGPVGAVRTELGHTLVMGSTNVRDGRWHHVAIVLVPDADARLHVKQYVDGRLDGSSTAEIVLNRSADMAKTEALDTLWLGRSPADRPKEDFFTGDLDELFVIDRALSPQEVVRLMHENQPDAVVAGTL